jgi:hypothetical protein
VPEAITKEQKAELDETVARAHKVQEIMYAYSGRQALRSGALWRVLRSGHGRGLRTFIDSLKKKALAAMLQAPLFHIHGPRSHQGFYRLTPMFGDGEMV